MKSSDALTNIAEALAQAQAEVRAAFKSGDNKFDRYRYAKYEDIANAAKPVMAIHGLSVLFSSDELVALDDRLVGEKKDKADHAVRVKVTARLLHKSGEWMESIAWGEGQDRADKAPYKAMTGAKKYLLAGLLAIPTTDDPESDEQVGTGEGTRHDRAPGSKPSTQAAPQGNGQPGDRLIASAARYEASKPSAASSGSTANGAKSAPATTAAATPEPTAAELRASKQRADQARELFDEKGLPKKAKPSEVDQKRISEAFSRAAQSTSRDEALECLTVVAGEGVKAPGDVPTHKVEPLITALYTLAGIEV